MNKNSAVTSPSTLSLPMSVSAVQSVPVPSVHPVPTAVASTGQQDRAHHAHTGGWVGGFVRAGRNADGQDYTMNISTAVPFQNISSTGMSSRAEHGCVGVSSNAVGVVPSVSGARLGVLQQPIMCEGGFWLGSLME